MTLYRACDSYVVHMRQRERRQWSNITHCSNLGRRALDRRECRIRCLCCLHVEKIESRSPVMQHICSNRALLVIFYGIDEAASDDGFKRELWEESWKSGGKSRRC
jgi:hypothetical protein